MPWTSTWRKELQATHCLFESLSPHNKKILCCFTDQIVACTDVFCNMRYTDQCLFCSSSPKESVLSEKSGTQASVQEWVEHSEHLTHNHSQKKQTDKTGIHNMEFSSSAVQCSSGSHKHCSEMHCSEHRQCTKCQCHEQEEIAIKRSLKIHAALWMLFLVFTTRGMESSERNFCSLFCVWYSLKISSVLHHGPFAASWGLQRRRVYLSALDVHEPLTQRIHHVDLDPWLDYVRARSALTSNTDAWGHCNFLLPPGVGQLTIGLRHPHQRKELNLGLRARRDCRELRQIQRATWPQGVVVGQMGVLKILLVQSPGSLPVHLAPPLMVSGIQGLPVCIWWFSASSSGPQGFQGSCCLSLRVTQVQEKSVPHPLHTQDPSPASGDLGWRSLWPPFFLIPSWLGLVESIFSAIPITDRKRCSRSYYACADRAFRRNTRAAR